MWQALDYWTRNGVAYTISEYHPCSHLLSNEKLFMSTSKRKPIPQNIQRRVLYKCARVCCVCRERGAPIELHHIDQDRNNNTEDNIVAICRNCHDSAHSTHTMSKNLTSAHLKNSKRRWESEVRERSTLSMLPGNNSSFNQAIWTYINHQRLPFIFKNAGIEFEPRRFEHLMSLGAVDLDGTPQHLTEPKSHLPYVTVYDYMTHPVAMELHHLYAETLGRFITQQHPIDLEPIWNKTDIKALVFPGTLCFILRAFYFKRLQKIDNVEERRVYRKKGKIKIELMASTRHMFGSSALHDSFSGRRTIAALFFVKSIDKEEDVLVIRGTPLAMGAEFIHCSRNTPYPFVDRQGISGVPVNYEEDGEDLEWLDES